MLPGLFRNGRLNVAHRIENRPRHAWETDGPSDAAVIGKSLPRGVDAGHGWPRDPLLVSEVENQIPVEPQAEHGRDAVRRIRLEVMLHGLT